MKTKFYMFEKNIFIPIKKSMLNLSVAFLAQLKNREPLDCTGGTLRFCETLVENHWSKIYQGIAVFWSFAYE